MHMEETSMNLEEYREKREKEDAERIAALPVWLVKWKSDGKYLASDRANKWTKDRSAASFVRRSRRP